MTPLKTIRLYGKLGTRFGRIHRLAVASAAEAVRALCMTRPGFERELMTSRDRGVDYAVFLGKKNIRQEELVDPAGKDDIRIAPVLQGASKGGIFQIILGAALMVFAMWAQGSFTSLGSLSEALKAKSWIGVTAMMGMSMMMGGVLQLLSPQMKGLSTRDNVENGASYAFNGAVNTTAQGNPVPVGYGRMIVGSAVISAGIYAMDQK